MHHLPQPRGFGRREVWAKVFYCARFFLARVPGLSSPSISAERLVWTWSKSRSCAESLSDCWRRKLPPRRTYRWNLKIENGESKTKTILTKPKTWPDDWLIDWLFDGLIDDQYLSKSSVNCCRYSMSASASFSSWIIAADPSLKWRNIKFETNKKSVSVNPCKSNVAHNNKYCTCPPRGHWECPFDLCWKLMASAPSISVLSWRRQRTRRWSSQQEEPECVNY